VKHHRALKAVPLKTAVPAGMETIASSPAPGPSPAVAAPAEAPRGAREILGEAEKLLSQGEVASACARGEEARQVAPKLPAISRFLGKCYMRAGNVPKASERYKTYLELAPDAPDAAFIKSIVK
jgi:Flp pilus assembly protein TadD